MTIKLGVFFNPLNPDRNYLYREKERISKMDVDHIEILLDHYKFLDSSGKELTLLKSFTNDLENILHAPFIGTSIIHSNKELRSSGIKVNKSSIEAARVLDSKLITIHGGQYPFYIEDENFLHDNFNEAVSELIDLSDQYGIAMAVENTPQMQGVSRSFPSLFGQVKKALLNSKKLGLTLDIGHVMENNENIISYMKEFNGRIKNVHVHDSNGVKSHLGIGKGVIDIESVLEAAKQLKNVYMSLEILDDKDTLNSFNFIKNIISSSSARSDLRR